MLHEGRKKFQNWCRDFQCLRGLRMRKTTIAADLERKHLRSEFVGHVLVIQPLFFPVVIRLNTRRQEQW